MDLVPDRTLPAVLVARIRKSSQSWCTILLIGMQDGPVSTSAITAVNVQVPMSATAPIVADFAEHAIRVAYVTRRDVARLSEQEWATPGIYLLLCDDGTHNVYVGKSTNLRSRVHQHKQKNAQVPAWARAVLVKRDTSHGFTSADVGYLEGRVSAQLDVIPGISVVKGKVDGDATLPRHMQMSFGRAVALDPGSRSPRRN